MTMNLFADAGGPLLYLVVFGGMAIAGVTVFAGLVLGGLWIARRLRGEPPAAASDPPEGEAPPSP